MKTIKFLFWLIILVLLGTLIYQNLAYFMAPTPLTLDLQIAGWSWTIPPIQNIAYFGICFLLGLILAGIKGLLAVFCLKKQIKDGNKTIISLKAEMESLKTELDVFKHDPYIKKELENKAGAEPDLREISPDQTR
jgi:hypothetical protein